MLLLGSDVSFRRRTARALFLVGRIDLPNLDQARVMQQTIREMRHRWRIGEELKRVFHRPTQRSLKTQARSSAKSPSVRELPR
jgi:hypothetical protein